MHLVAQAVGDPFGPAVRRSQRMAEQYATLRSPTAPVRSVGLQSTLVNARRNAMHRAASVGAVWSVGGTPVTEGIASTTNGRGGRVTSGTRAAHHQANFLRRNSRSEDERTHGHRLALAFDFDQSPRMVGNNSPSSSSSPPSLSLTSSPCSPLSDSPSTPSPTRTVWRDGRWQRNGTPTPSKQRPKKPKEIPIIPFRVLDAPALRDDYYCSPLTYSDTIECLAVALGPHVHLWSEKRTAHTTIPESLSAPAAAHVTAVSFSSTQGGNAILAIGRADGRISLWSPHDRDPRFDSEHPSPVSCVCFRPTTAKRASIREPSVTVNTEELLVGDEAGNVYFYSIEWPNEQDRDLFGWHGSMTLLARMSCHTQQICGLAWSADGETFATGGNDNQMFVFETKKILAPQKRRNKDAATVHVRNGSSSEGLAGQGEVISIAPGRQRHIFNLNAAVKAIAFAPWRANLIAAGGGSNDRCIHFFHTRSGAALATIDCYAQVTSLVWSVHKRELAATFGFAQPEHPFRVAVFSWPDCKMVVAIPWYGEERALYAVAYPRCLVVATSDASIKFHEVWSETSRRAGPSRLLEGSDTMEGPEIR